LGNREDRGAVVDGVHPVGHQHVAALPDSADQFCRARMRLQLFAEPGNLDIDAAFGGGAGRVVGLLEDFISRHGLIDVIEQHLEQIELRIREIYLLTRVAGYGMAAKIDDHVVDPHARLNAHSARGRLFPGAQNGADPGDQFARLERFDDIIIRAGIKTGNPFIGANTSAENKHGDV